MKQNLIKKKENKKKFKQFLLVCIVLLLIFSFGINALKKNYVSDGSPLVTIDFDTQVPVILDSEPTIFKDGKKVIVTFSEVEQNFFSNSYFFKISESSSLADGTYEILTSATDNFGTSRNYSELLIVDTVNPEIDYINPPNLKFISGVLFLEFNFTEQVIFDILLDDELVAHNDIINTNPEDAITFVREGLSLKYQNGLYKLYSIIPNGEHSLKIEFLDYASNGKIIKQIDFLSFDGEFKLIETNYPFGYIDKLSAELNFSSPIDATCRYKLVSSFNSCGNNGYASAELSGENEHTFRVNSLVEDEDLRLCYSCLDNQNNKYQNSKVVRFDTDKPSFINTFYNPKTAIVTLSDAFSKFNLDFSFSHKEDKTFCMVYNDTTNTSGLDLKNFIKTPEFILSNEDFTYASELTDNFDINHRIDFLDLKDETNYNYYLRCMNPSGLISDPYNIEFEVDSKKELDFSILNNLYTKTNSFKLKLLTNVKADRCIYKINNGDAKPFNTLNNFDFDSDLTLADGKTNIEITCANIRSSKKKSFDFVVDKTMPVINNFVFDDVILENDLLVTIKKSKRNNLAFELNFTDEFSDKLNISYRIGNSTASPSNILSATDHIIYEKGTVLEESLRDKVEKDQTFLVSVLISDLAGNTNNQWLFSKNILFGKGSLPTISDLVPPNVSLKVVNNADNNSINVVCRDSKSLTGTNNFKCKSLKYIFLNTTTTCNFTSILSYHDLGLINYESLTLYSTKDIKLCVQASDFSNNKKNFEQLVPLSPNKCIDLDGDGYGDGCNLGVDCDDSNSTLTNNCNNGCTVDNDKDGYGIDCDLGWDCNDTDATLTNNCDNGCLLDIDGDGHGIKCNLGWDCNDRNLTLTNNCDNGCLIDTDGDGYGWKCNLGWDCNDVNSSVKLSECENGCVYDFDGDGRGLGCFNDADCDETNLNELTCDNNCLFDDDCDAVDNNWENIFGSNKNIYDSKEKLNGNDLTNIEEYRNDPLNPRSPTTGPDITAPEIEDTGGISNPFIWGLIVMIIVLLVAWGGYYIYKRNENKTESDSDLEDDFSVDSDFTPMGGSNNKTLRDMDYGDESKDSRSNNSALNKEIKLRSQKRMNDRSSLINKLFGFKTDQNSNKESSLKSNLKLDKKMSDYIDLNDLKKKNKKPNISKQFSEFDKLDAVIKKHGHKVNNKLIQKLNEKDRKLIFNFLKHNNVKVKNNRIDIDEFKRKRTLVDKNGLHKKIIKKYDLDDSFSKLHSVVNNLNKSSSKRHIETALESNKLDKKLKKKLSDKEYKNIVSDLKSMIDSSDSNKKTKKTIKKTKK